MVEYIGLVERGLECPSYPGARNYIKENKQLSSPCNECFTITIWSAKENVERFVNFFRSKFGAVPRNREFKQIYLRLRGEKKKEDFIREYEEKLKNQGIESTIRWGRCCGKIKREFPSLFRGAKKLSEGMQLELFEKEGK